jgi:hypothetical protein
MPSLSMVIVFATSAATLALASGYLRRFAVTRPPIGVMNWYDVAFFMAAIVTSPLLYMVLPRWLAAVALIPFAVGIVYFTAEPVLRQVVARAAAAVLLIAVDVTLLRVFGGNSPIYLFVNNLVIVVMIVGAANLWVQSGMGPAHLAILAIFLAAYDIVAVNRLPFLQIIIQLSGNPASPFIAWRTPFEGQGVGLGDLLFLTAFTLAIRKAYGRTAWLSSVVVGLLGLLSSMELIQLGIIATVVPVMVLLGPLTFATYAFWASRQGSGRTTRQYMEAEPMVTRA